MQIQKTNPRLFDDFDPDLWKEAEQGEKENKEFIALWGKTRVKYLYDQAKNHKKDSKEYYELIAQLVELCQNGPLGLGHFFSDKAWVSEAVLYLVDLYKPLLTKTSYWALHRYSSIVPHYEYSDFEELTKTLFTRFILGDTSWAINYFKDQDKHTQDTFEHLGEIHIHKRWHDQQEYVEELRQNLQAKVNDEDMRVVEMVQLSSTHFSIQLVYAS